MSAKVSIIMPAYKTAGFIAASIDSVLAQTYANWELVIVDDGSPDDVLQVIEPYLTDSRIVCRSFTNGGLATARNRGIELATGEFMALLDSDDLFEPTYLDEMMARFAADPGLSFVTCDATMFGVPTREGRRFSEFESQAGEITLDRVLARQFNIFICVTARLADVRAAGSFNTALRAAEDFDLWTKLLASGKRAGYVAKPLVRYRRRADSLSAATPFLMLNLIRVYVDRLADLPADSASAVIVRQRLKAALEAVDLSIGERALYDGDLEKAGRFLEEAMPRPSLSWRLTLFLMKFAPAIARPILRRRQRKNASKLALAPAA